MTYQQTVRKNLIIILKVSNYNLVLALLLLEISGKCYHLALITFSHITK